MLLSVLGIQYSLLCEIIGRRQCSSRVWAFGSNKYCSRVQLPVLVMCALSPCVDSGTGWVWELWFLSALIDIHTLWGPFLLLIPFYKYKVTMVCHMQWWVWVLKIKHGPCYYGCPAFVCMHMHTHMHAFVWGRSLVLCCRYSQSQSHWDKIGIT